VPREWVEESTRAFSDIGQWGGYGYLWWVAPNGGPHFTSTYFNGRTFSARGFGGHFIVAVPYLDLVVVHRVDTDVDAVAQDSRFKPLLALDKVGVYGMSAGGHTALSLAGGRWSPARFREHCEAHMADDFYSCVGLAVRRQRNVLDGATQTLALWVIRFKFPDAAWQTHADPRVAAIVAAVPYAADFDLKSLAAPPVPLGLVTARLDAWLVPRFHGDAVLRACAACETVADIRDGGHGALLSPLPPGLTGLLGELLNDPPGFNRAVLPEVDRKIAAYFSRHLLP
jgi:hypothetical protein